MVLDEYIFIKQSSVNSAFKNKICLNFRGAVFRVEDLGVAMHTIIIVMAITIIIIITIVVCPAVGVAFKDARPVVEQAELCAACAREVAA